ncbi:MAG: DNA-binding protein [Planctomycetota bacterium]|nr:MAG: DNA-binding protein [Planctomycetota bacterium]
MGLAATYAIPGFHEPVSCFTHLLAAPVFAIWGIWLIRRGRGSVGRMLSLGVLVFSTVFLLSISGVYHLLGPGTARYVLKILDIAGIFALIAGTATPVHYILYRGKMRWLPLLAYWAVAATGISLRSVFPEGLPLALGVGVFLAMGWAGVVTMFLMWRQFGYDFIRALLMGGAAYSVGAVLLLLDWPVVLPGVIGPHELWHVAVLGGLFWHWRFVSQLVELQRINQEAIP